MPSVDVIVPCYNAAGYLPATLDSALAQRHQPLRIVVVDDGSTDGTRAVVERYGDRVDYVRKTNGGQASARNLGIRNTSGDYVLCLDADDLIAPTMVERLVNRLEASPEADLAHASPLAFFDGDRVGSGRAETWRPEGGWINYLEPCSFLCAIHGSSAVLRRRAFERYGMFPEERALQGCEDWHLWLRASAHGAHIEHVDGVLSWYRQHPASSSASPRAVARRESELITLAPALFERAGRTDERSMAILSLGMKRIAIRWLLLGMQPEFERLWAHSEAVAPNAFRLSGHACTTPAAPRDRAALTLLHVSSLLCTLGASRLAAVVLAQTPGSARLPTLTRATGLESSANSVIRRVGEIVDAEADSASGVARPSFFANVAVWLGHYERAAARTDEARRRYAQATALDAAARGAWLGQAALDARALRLADTAGAVRRALKGNARGLATDVARGVLSRCPRTREFVSGLYRDGVSALLKPGRQR